MSGEVISFTTVEYPDEASMLKAREVFQQEMSKLADKLRPLGMTRFHSSRLFLPEDRFIIGNLRIFQRNTDTCSKMLP